MLQLAWGVLLGQAAGLALSVGVEGAEQAPVADLKAVLPIEQLAQRWRQLNLRSCGTDDPANRQLPLDPVQRTRAGAVARETCAPSELSTEWGRLEHSPI